MKFIKLFINKFKFVSGKKNLTVISKNNTFKNEQFKYLKTRHTWHLVDPSPWPLVASLGAFFMTSGTVLYMNKFLGGGQLATIGLFVLLYVMYTW